MERKPTDIVQLKLRIREDLRQRLEAAADERRISMNALIAERLEQSFLADKAILRVRLPHRGDLERIAAEQGRSVSEEVERRLERSFVDDLILYGEHGPAHIRQAIQTIARVFSSLELLSGRKAFGPDGDPWLHEQAWKALSLWFGATRPPGATSPPSQLPVPAYRRNRSEMETLGLELMAHQLAGKPPATSLDEARALRAQLDQHKGEGDDK